MFRVGHLWNAQCSFDAPEMIPPQNIVLRVRKPLYGIPESGIHWYLTYLEHHLGELGMTTTRSYRCVHNKRTEEGIQAIVALQVEEALGLGSESFLAEEKQASKMLKSYPRKLIKEGSFNCNGLNITQEGHQLHINQPEKIGG